jgi:phenylacetic acid degradation operon negative regulatory protein
MTSASRSARKSTRTSSPLEDRQREVADLLEGVRPATAHAVLATALLGAEQPRLPVASLVAVASLFGISPGAARTCLWRMVSDRELTTDRATYALTGRLLERRQRVDTAARTDHTPGTWDGTWEVNVVALDRRGAMDRLELRKAASALHLAEIREGVWTRPDNLPPDREAAARAVVDQQCVHYRGATSNISNDAVTELFDLRGWATTAQRLLVAMHRELAAAPYEGDDLGATLSHQFTLSIGVVGHLERDPLLPAAFLPRDWPAEELRTVYRAFDQSFQHTMNAALRQPTKGRT